MLIKPLTAKPMAAPAFIKCPAKTHELEERGGVRVPGRDVAQHCQIVGEVARALIARYPEQLGKALFPKGSPLVAAAHDIGKVSPCFYEKLRRACGDGVADWPAFGVNPELERQWGGHAGVSQAVAQAVGAPSWVAEIVGQHHGFSPQLLGKCADDEVFGGAQWQAQRNALVEELKLRLGMDWPHVTSPEQARVLAGLTSVADWIGSGRYFEDPSQPWKPGIHQALDEAGFIPPTYRRGLRFDEVFPFSPLVAQTRLIEAVRGPGVYVFEAPMGLGKTEAALYAAYRMLEQGLACGIYFALPTQLTSNKIHERFSNFLESILAEDCRHGSWLLHGKAWLVDTDMGEECRPGGAWFNQSKRGLLAPFAVGTIDQALMAAMNVKHGFVRAFGLAGKVVILDEVHSYDTYTGTLLDALVRLLRALHCTVIVLSATLSHERRSQLLNCTVRDDAYPLVTAVPNGRAVQEIPAKDEQKATDGQMARVSLAMKQNQVQALREALARAADGQQVLWIENTVKDAQTRYLDLAASAAELGVECGLLHSRFSAANREHIEAHWVDLFGKPGWGRRGERGRILVGTQVLEQSLDIDADFLVSRFAPTDMLLQRLGRLWRHAEAPREKSATREAWLLSPLLAEAVEDPPTAFGASAHVYNPYVLCRSLEVWQGRAWIDLPHDIRGLIEATYAERQEVDAMARWLHELDEGTRRHKGRRTLRQLARIGLAKGGKTLPESHAQTRYSETDNIELLLLRGIQRLPERKASRLILLDGSEVILPQRRHELDKPQWKALAVRLAQQVVPVPTYEAPHAVSRDTLEQYCLQHCFHLGDPNWPDDECLLRVALLDDTGILRGLDGTRYGLEYRDDLGYRVVKR